MFKIFCSSKALPMICSLMGNLWHLHQLGIEIAGSPAKFTGTVNISFKYIETGSLVFSPILNAALGVDGVNIASTFL